MSIDGNIAAGNGESRYISRSGSLALAQELRRTHDAILVGIGTVLRDDPLLTSRSQPGTDPLRVVLDSKLRMPLSSRIADTATEVPTLLITRKENIENPRAEELRRRGIEIIGSSADHIGLDLGEILNQLSDRGVDKLMVEGGSRILSSFLMTRLWDRMLVVSAPLFLGPGIGPFDEAPLIRLDQGIKPRVNEIRIIGNEVVWDLSPGEDDSGSGAA